MIAFQRSGLPVDRCTKKAGECPQTVFRGGGAGTIWRSGYARLRVRCTVLRMSEQEMQVVVHDEVFASAVSHSTPSPGRNTFSSAVSMTHSQRQQDGVRYTAPGVTARKVEDNRVTRDINAVTASGDQPYMFYDFIELEDAQVQ